VLVALLLLLFPAAASAVPTQNAAATTAESFVIKSDGTLWAWGGNAYGELGTGDTLPRGIPVQVGVDTNWKTIVNESSSSLVALKQDGTVWHWGDNPPWSPVQYTGSPAWAGPWDALTAGDGYALLLKNGGQLWKASGVLAPLRIGTDTWTSIAAGGSHNLAVRADGSLWAWGSNDYGQLGLGDNVDRAAPTQVGSATDWQAVYCGSLTSYAITTSGKLYAWGWNEDGQLGLGSAGGTRLSPVAVSGSGWSGARVAPGPLDCLAVKSDGTLWACGYNADGQLGLPADYADHDTFTRVGTATTWADVACGPYHTVAVTTNDEFAACGANQYGQIGLGFPLYRCSPEQIGTVGGWVQVDASLTHAGGVRSDGTLWMWGSNISGTLGGSSGSLNTPTQIGTDTDWKQVSCGAYTDADFTAAIKTGGTLWMWGDNGAGQLGLGDRASRDVPTQVGGASDWATVACSDGVGDRGREIVGTKYTLDDHTLAVKSDGTLWAWGADDYGQLGLGDNAARLTPQQVGTGTDWQSVAAGDDYSAALKTDGTLWVWGHNQCGQLGQGGTASVNVPTQVLTGSGAETFSTIACGSGRDSSHMLAVKTDGTLWGWGLNYIGELGQGSVNHEFDSPIQIGSSSDWASVACGSYFGDDYSLATKTDGELWAWGGNYRGQLGNGDYVPLFTPTQVTGVSDWQHIVAGSSSFATKPDGTLWSWGDNTWGQLGLGDPAAYSSTTVYPLESFTDTIAPTVSGSATAGKASAPGGLAVECTPRRASGGWSRTPRKITVKASDAGSGLSRTQISTSGGVGYVTRSSLTVTNGDIKVWCRAIDRAGNHSVAKFIGRYRIDTTKPKLTASRATVKRGARAILKYRISDYSPCRVKIVIENSHRRAVKTFFVKSARPGSALVKSFTCKLTKGAYRWYVYATDSVGLKQAKAGSNRLSVK